MVVNIPYPLAISGTDQLPGGGGGLQLFRWDLEPDTKGPATLDLASSVRKLKQRGRRACYVCHWSQSRQNIKQQGAGGIRCVCQDYRRSPKYLRPKGGGGEGPNSPKIHFVMAFQRILGPPRI